MLQMSNHVREASDDDRFLEEMPIVANELNGREEEDVLTVMFQSEGFPIDEKGFLHQQM